MAQCFSAVHQPIQRSLLKSSWIKCQKPYSLLLHTTSHDACLPLPPSPAALAHRHRLIRSATNQLPFVAPSSSPISALQPRAVPPLPGGAGLPHLADMCVARHKAGPSLAASLDSLPLPRSARHRPRCYRHPDLARWRWALAPNGISSPCSCGMNIVPALRLLAAVLEVLGCLLEFIDQL
jgi:hypothetical protein